MKLFKTRTVADVTKGLTKMVADLRTVSEENMVEAARQREIAGNAKLSEQAAIDEASAAFKAADKIEDLIS